MYLGNYVTALAASGTNTVPLDFLRSELDAARQLEPDNARFDYLEAGRLLNAAAEISTTGVSKQVREALGNLEADGLGFEVGDVDTTTVSRVSFFLVFFGYFGYFGYRICMGD